MSRRRGQRRAAPLGAVLACGLAALALSGLLATGAGAATLSSSTYPKPLRLSGGLITLETAAGRVLFTCKGAEAAPEWYSSAELEGVEELEGCFAERLPPMTCTTPGLPAGRILTSRLRILPVDLDAANTEAGLLFEPETAGGAFAEFRCVLQAPDGGRLVDETLRVTGSVIARVPTEELRRQRSSLNLEFRETGGRPRPSLVAGAGSPHVLTVEGRGTEPFPAEEAGLQELFPGETVLSAGAGWITLYP